MFQIPWKKPICRIYLEHRLLWFCDVLCKQTRSPETKWLDIGISVHFVIFAAQDFTFWSAREKHVSRDEVEHVGTCRHPARCLRCYKLSGAFSSGAWNRKLLQFFSGCVHAAMAYLGATEQVSTCRNAMFQLHRSNKELSLEAWEGIRPQAECSLEEVDEYLRSLNAFVIAWIMHVRAVLGTTVSLPFAISPMGRFWTTCINCHSRTIYGDAMTRATLLRETCSLLKCTNLMRWSLLRN